MYFVVGGCLDFSLFLPSVSFISSPQLLCLLSPVVTCDVHQTFWDLLPNKLQILILDVNSWACRLSRRNLINLNKIDVVFQLLIPACKNLSPVLSCLYFQTFQVGVSSVTHHPEWSPPVPPNTHAFKPRRWHTIPTTLFETIWNGSVEVFISRITIMVLTCPDAISFLCQSHFSTPLILPDSLPLRSLMARHFLRWHVVLCFQAGLLGCEAVLSSMALMQANSIPGQKKMMSSLGHGHRASSESQQSHSQHSHHGHQVHHGQPHNSHMGHPSTGSCPPLVREIFACRQK